MVIYGKQYQEVPLNNHKPTNGHEKGTININLILSKTNDCACVNYSAQNDQVGTCLRYLLN